MDELLLTQNLNGYTVFQLAALKNHVEILTRMWVWAEETQFNPNELKNKLLLAKDIDGFVAATEQHLETFYRH